MTLKVKELGHATLKVADLARSVAFYRDLLGMPEVGRLWNGRAAMFSTGRTHHELLLIEVGPGGQGAFRSLRRAARAKVRRLFDVMAGPSPSTAVVARSSSARV